ncbi:aminopeptidase P family N-terminal domain-containing protein [Ruminococcaceae bacterium OttesenSCG-928-L11]|nr:aminopeptidase P family N-terminal domain-containing protein [Ruminococcaceae bacterium OttesenSCG-928-L11]
MNEKLAYLAQRLPSSADCAVLHAPIHHRYYLGFQCSYGILAVTREQALFLTDARYIEAAEKAISGCVVRLQTDPAAQLREFMADSGQKTVGMDADTATLGAVDRVRALTGTEPVTSSELAEVLRRQRACKSREEQEAIGKAHTIAEAVMEQAAAYIGSDMSADDIRRELGMLAGKAGSQLASFDFAVDRNGDAMTVQVRAGWGGYQSELVRTVSMGTADEAMSKAYAAAREAHIRLLGSLCPGDGQEPAASPGRILHSRHGIGLEPEESPYAADRMEAGHVLSAQTALMGETGPLILLRDVVVVEETGGRALSMPPEEMPVWGGKEKRQ